MTEINYLMIFITILSSSITYALYTQVTKLKLTMFEKRNVETDIAYLTRIKEVNTGINDTISIVFTDYFESEFLTRLALQKKRMSTDEIDELVIELSSTVLRMFSDSKIQSISKAMNMKTLKNFQELIVIKVKKEVNLILLASKVSVDSYRKV